MSSIWSWIVRSSVSSMIRIASRTAGFCRTRAISWRNCSWRAACSDSSWAPAIPTPVEGASTRATAMTIAVRVGEDEGLGLGLGRFMFGSCGRRL